MLAWAAGGEAPPREAEVVILDQGAQATVEALVALEPAAVTSWRAADRHPADGGHLGADGGRGARAAPPRVPGSDGAARHHRLRRHPGRRLARRALRRRGGGRPAALALRRVHQAAPRRQRVGAPGRRPDRPRRPQPARGAARRRPRRRADPGRERQLRRGGRRAAARRHRAARDHAARRAGLRARRPRAVVAALAGARRLHAARGPRAQPGRLRGRRPAALDPLPRLALGDGRALRRSEPEPLLEERLRRRRERRRHRRLAAHARLRLPGRDRLPRRRRLGRSGRSAAHPERDLHPRGGRRRALAAHRVARRLGRGAALAQARHLVVLGHRELRLRLLLVPLPGRHDRLRGQAHGRALDRRGGAGRAAGARHAGRSRAQRDGAPALLQHAPRSRHRRPGERRRRGLDRVAAAGSRQSRTATPSARAGGGSRASSRRGAGSTPPRRAGGRSSIRRSSTASASRSATASCRARRRSPSRSPTLP